MSVEVSLIVKKEIELEKNYNFLNKGSLTNEEKNGLKNFKKDSKRFRKYNNTTYDLDYLFNELNEPTKTQQKLIKGARDLFNELRSNLSCEKTKKIRERLQRKEAIYNFLKEKVKR